ncbi:hydantoinase B/oxoprolinase [Diplocarpon mali]|nr:hydantoinase B/oxoprolinase [Diplocarpon mali]
MSSAVSPPTRFHERLPAVCIAVQLLPTVRNWLGELDSGSVVSLERMELMCSDDAQGTSQRDPGSATLSSGPVDRVAGLAKHCIDSNERTPSTGGRGTSTNIGRTIATSLLVAARGGWILPSERRFCVGPTESLLIQAEPAAGVQRSAGARAVPTRPVPSPDPSIVVPRSDERLAVETTTSKLGQLANDMDLEQECRSDAGSSSRSGSGRWLARTEALRRAAEPPHASLRPEAMCVCRHAAQQSRSQGSSDSPSMTLAELEVERRRGPWSTNTTGRPALPSEVDGREDVSAAGIASSGRVEARGRGIVSMRRALDERGGEESVGKQGYLLSRVLRGGGP